MDRVAAARISNLDSCTADATARNPHERDSVLPPRGTVLEAVCACEHPLVRHSRLPWSAGDGRGPEYGPCGEAGCDCARWSHDGFREIAR